MTQRTVAGIGAFVLLGALVLVAVVVPVPYVTYRPGPTVDILGETDGKEILQITGADTYYDVDGELRLTTIRVSQPDDQISLFTAVAAWLDRDNAIYPYDLQYPDATTDEEQQEEGQLQMLSSQDNAVATALRELGYDIEASLAVLDITRGMPADGALAPRDLLVAVDGVDITADEAGQKTLIDAISSTKPGESVTLTVIRDGKKQTVEVEPADSTDDEGNPTRVIGIQMGLGFEDFPVKVDFALENIGGPSAGLMFSLAIYDTLTPGSLAGGHDIAGTGEISPDGTVGAIGGIQQKIAGARAEGAELFLVPAENCADALGARAGDVRLVRAETMSQALSAVKAWVADPESDLPSCEDEA